MIFVHPKNRKRLVLGLWFAEVILGIIMMAVGVLNYHNTLCDCPAVIIGNAAASCNCINSVALFSLWAGIAFTVLGLLGIVISSYRFSRMSKRGRHR